MTSQPLVIVSMSGGLDSATLVARALDEGYTVQTLSFQYGQKHFIELYCQQELSKIFKERYPNRFLDTITVNLSVLNQEMTDTYKRLRDEKIIEDKSDLEYYTPSRNLLFSVLSAQYGEIIALSKGYRNVLVGLGIHKHLEYRNYWDITVDFADRLQSLLALNDVVNMNIYVPYVSEEKSKIVEDSIKLQVPYKKTWTCYSPVLIEQEKLIRARPCGMCEACIERQKAGEKVGIKDINDYEIDITLEELKDLRNGKKTPE